MAGQREARRVHAYWDGKVLVSRLGNTFHAPDWLLAGLPAVPLDGELWVGRKAFQRTVGIVRRQDGSDHWKEVAFLVFETPPSKIASNSSGMTSDETARLSPGRTSTPPAGTWTTSAPSWPASRPWGAKA